MAVGAFPLAKLGFLVIKQISKPIANSFAKRAKSSRIFREYICIPVAQLFHWYDVRVRMRILNLGKVTSIPKLNEEKAIETGSQILSEFIILSIASGLIVYEYRRQSEKEDMKQEQIEREKAYINDKLINLELTLEQQSAQIRELTRLTYSLQDKSNFKIFSNSNKKEAKPTQQTSNPNVASSQIERSESPQNPRDIQAAKEGTIMNAVNDLLDRGIFK